MNLRVVMLGDIVGTPGRQAVAQQLPVIRERYRPHLVMANAENASNGTGLTPSHYRKLKDAGVDGVTLGDHVYKKVQIVSVLEQESDIARPANLPTQAAGKRWFRLKPAEANLPTVYVVTVLGRIFMGTPANDPFATVEQVLTELPERDPVVVVEIHAEATSEKIAMGRYFDGRVSAVLGSHTHVPTADARILPGGTAYITDLGMSGPHDSVLGREVGAVVKQMTTAMPVPFDVAQGDPRVNGVVIDIDARTRKAVHIERIELPADRNKPPFVLGAGSSDSSGPDNDE
ncbi:MAG: TIGR00282 family metallophosphoesterase [Phycisphaera sp.]|nr:TIGR00282 family metallophosphoesterase [Phycisphaera sp.]